MSWFAAVTNTTYYMKTKPIVLLFFMTMLTTVFAMPQSQSLQRIKLNSQSPNIPRSFSLSTSAIIDGSLLFINFSSPVESITVIVTDTETGEMVYSYTYSNIEEITIDLNGLDAGKYTLEILLDTTTLVGDFYI